MHELYYVTSNQGKYEEVRRFFELHIPSVTIKQVRVELDELQDLDPQVVVRHKAQQAWDLVQKPLLVDDSGFYLQAFPRFPGTLAKPVMKALGFAGLKILTKADNRSLIFVTLAYVTGPNTLVTFYGETSGHVFCENENAEHLFSRFGFYSVFKPEGSEKTYYELRLLSWGQKFFHRNKALEKFLLWYKPPV
jgi:non-canonical purine NTP pyrophosphatase (RdgB/HAM1 family)